VQPVIPNSNQVTESSGLISVGTYEYIKRMFFFTWLCCSFSRLSEKLSKSSKMEDQYELDKFAINYFDRITIYVIQFN
jgi:hypothetical protein